jgi:predicted nucleotidyltransferase
MSGPLGELAQVQQALDQAFESHGVVLAYLYGSQARGDAGPLSDVDVAVLFGPDLTGF